MCNIQGGVHCLTSDSRNNIWGRVCCVTRTFCVFGANDAIALCQEWDVNQLCYFMDSITEMKRSTMPVPVTLTCHPHVKAADCWALQSFSAWHLWFLGAYVKGLKDCGIYKCTVPILSAKQATLDNCVLQKLQHLKLLNFLNIVTVHVVSVMCIQKEIGEQFCACIKYVVFVFKNMSKSLKSVRL
jgi:hypothetical protein